MGRLNGARPSWRPLAGAGVVILLDQALKLLASARLAWGGRLPLAGDALVLEPVLNPGASFGIPAGTPLLLAGLSLAGVAWILGTGGQAARGLAGAPIGLVAGGALSNSLDRLRLGGVLDVLVLGGRLAFNLADGALLAGVLLGVAAAWRSRKRGAQRVS